MKRILTYTAAVVAALSFGSVYGAERMEAGNGITLFAKGPAVFDIGPTNPVDASTYLMGGSAAGGVESMEHGYAGVESGSSNGITLFASGPEVFDIGPTDALSLSGSAAGGVSDVQSISPHNGVTIFSQDTAVYDIGPTE
jgi:hypothetical protein